jgi:hypothetical protein
MSKPKILFFDIETAPIMAWIWSMWSEFRNYEMIEREWYILCWAAKWQGGKEIITSALPDFTTYDKDPEDDRECVLELWRLLDEADILVAHNAKGFDVKKANARFLIHGLLPPSPYKIVDTLLEARGTFKMTSNKLDVLGRLLGVGRKVPHEGFELWRKCMRGDMKAWTKMVVYCKQDVRLLERVYDRLLPYMGRHPNSGVYSDNEGAECPKCSAPAKELEKRGFTYTGVSKFQRLRCRKCGSWCRGRENLLKKGKRKNLVTNIAR